MQRSVLFVWLAMLTIPAAGLLGPHEESSPREMRMLAKAPSAPRSLAAWTALPREIDAFVRDQFGFRLQLIGMSASLREQLNDNNDSLVIAGRDGYLLLRVGFFESLGLVTAPEAALRDGALICEMQRRLAEANIPFILSIAPSPTSIYPEIAPEWAGEPQSPTNYDLLVAAARACGANTLDLRAGLRAARYSHQLYHRTDTHWTPRGALLAYNDIAAALGRPDLNIDPGSLVWRSVDRLGDLTRMANASDETVEPVETPDPPPINPSSEKRYPPPAEHPQMFTFSREYPREGPHVMVIGDSFAASFLEFLPHVARKVSFVHHQRCRFDWSEVRDLRPDIVIFAPTERFALCEDGARPANFD